MPVYDVLKRFADPYFFLLLIMGLGLIIGWLRSERRGLSLKIVTFCWLLFYLLSIPLVSQGLSSTLESQNPQETPLPENVDSIIVLGAGVTPSVSIEGKVKTTLSFHSWVRCQHALELFRRYDQPDLILCGAKILSETPGTGEAETMRDYLIEQRVPPEKIYLENKSRNTFENIKNAAELVKKQKYQQVLLVTHAYHLPRALLCCRKQKLTVSASGCDYRQKQHWRPWYTDVIATLGDFSQSQSVIHEWIGITWYRLSGKL
ncbi:hypothetical protein MNBD_PLANCTO02-124 [hydrothermal vent metagenome]|uniref:DUF218 domain-containing protein n=1 Tax=hydrothermal vent metagenome TaxID=652676 RepID=A0A3B1DSD7_9ZZZZ